MKHINTPENQLNFHSDIVCIAFQELRAAQLIFFNRINPQFLFCIKLENPTDVADKYGNSIITIISSKSNGSTLGN